MKPDIFTFGEIQFSPFAVMIIVAFIFCLVLGYFDAEKQGLRQKGFNEWDLLPAILFLITGAVGARLIYAIQNLDLFVHNPELFFLPRYAAVTSFGAIAGGLITIYLWCYFRKKNFFILLDTFALWGGVGYGIIRIGCFLTGCCYGKVTDLPWGVVMVNVDNLPRHPVQLYASLGVLIGFFIMVRLRRVKPFHGFITLAIVGYYGILRFTTEFFRAEPISRAEPILWLGLTKAQLAAVGMVIFSAVVIYVWYSAIEAKRRKGILPAEQPHNESSLPTSFSAKEQKPEKKKTAKGINNKKPVVNEKKKKQPKKKLKKKKK